jgi:membrane-associated phospholipid phosphatase
MSVSTVWGRYHYVADVFGGVITGTLGYFIGGWLIERRVPVEREHKLKSVPPNF